MRREERLYDEKFTEVALPIIKASYQGKGRLQVIIDSMATKVHRHGGGHYCRRARRGPAHPFHGIHPRGELGDCENPSRLGTEPGGGSQFAFPANLPPHRRKPAGIVRHHQEI
jgi:hypothetical protein